MHFISSLDSIFLFLIFAFALSSILLVDNNDYTALAFKPTLPSDKQEGQQQDQSKQELEQPMDLPI